MTLRARSCFLCRRDKPIADGTYVRVSLDGAVRDVCDDCFERGEEGIRIPLEVLMEGDE